jgi:hypothetical protein
MRYSFLYIFSSKFCQHTNLVYCMRFLLNRRFNLWGERHFYFLKPLDLSSFLMRFTSNINFLYHISYPSYEGNSVQYITVDFVTAVSQNAFGTLIFHKKNNNILKIAKKNRFIITFIISHILKQRYEDEDEAISKSTVMW